jgi:rubrerythrin
MSAMEELARDPASRRRFLSGLGSTAAAGSFAVFLAACGSKKEETTPGGSNPKTGAGTGTDRYGRGDLGIAIYALTLEYIETDFYAKAIESGKLKGPLLEMAKRFAAQEAQHIDALESFITDNGGKLTSRPKTTFDLPNEKVILQQAVTLENLGASAYLGQVDRITSKDLLAGALAIHGVEGRHAAAFSVAAKVTPTPNGAFATPSTAFNVITAIQPNIVQ